MQKTILITGSTDGIGLETAKMLLGKGHRVLLHGRNEAKLAKVEADLSPLGPVESYAADLSKMSEVDALAKAVAARHDQLDVLINNAGVLKVPDATTPEGLDMRFVVNTLAPYRLTEQLAPLLGKDARVVNLSSAAQDTVNADALRGGTRLGDMAAYSQSKLALTMWSREAAQVGGPVFIAVNPGSLLASKMVKEGFGMAGNDLSIGADILTRAAVDDDFADASGKYWDNDSGRFADPHPDALDQSKSAEVVSVMQEVLEGIVG